MTPGETDVGWLSAISHAVALLNVVVEATGVVVVCSQAGLHPVHPVTDHLAQPRTTHLSPGSAHQLVYTPVHTSTIFPIELKMDFLGHLLMNLPENFSTFA